MKITKSMLSLVLASAIGLSLVGCGSSSNQESGSTDNKATVTENKKPEKKASTKTKTSADGKTILKNMENLNFEQISGPIRAKITGIQIGKIKTNESSKKLFNNKDEVNFVVITMEVENTTGDTVGVYPDQGTLVTNTKEQVDANMFLSNGNLGGEYIGNVIKKGNVVFVVDSNLDEINNIKFTFDGPHDSSFERLGENITFDLNIQ